MTTIIAALFDHVSTAHSAVYTLVQYGIDRHKIQIMGQESDETVVAYVKEGYVAPTGFETLRQSDDMNQDHEEIRAEAEENRWTQAGFSTEEAQYYIEEIRRGGTLVIAQTDDGQIDDAVNVLQRYRPVKIVQQVVSLPENGGRKGLNAQASPSAQEQVAEAKRTNRSTVTRPPLSKDLREEDEI